MRRPNKRLHRTAARAAIGGPDWPPLDDGVAEPRRTTPVHGLRTKMFSVGMTVEFDTDEGRTISGTVARLNQKTATVVTAAGRWRVGPSLLRPASEAPASRTSAARLVAMPRRDD